MVWEDPRRIHKPIALEDLLRADADTRVIVVGDASMAPYELLHPRGAIDYTTRQRRSGQNCLEELIRRFDHHVWIKSHPLQPLGFRRGRLHHRDDPRPVPDGRSDVVGHRKKRWKF